jgi:K+-sensing histidine kinase KdpD
MQIMRPPRRPRQPGDPSAAIGLAVGVLGALVFSALLLPLRGHIPSADMALALVLPVLLGAITGGRVAGIGSAVFAALLFDFIFTEPYLTLRIGSKDDVVTFVFLALVAVAAAELGVRARRGRLAARDARDEIARLTRVAELSSRGVDADDVVSAARAELMGLFNLRDCVYESAPSSWALPRLGRRGAFEDTELVAVGEFLLPTGGVAIPVHGRGHDYGQLVLYAEEHTQAPIEKRLVAVAIADELGATLASSRV